MTDINVLISQELPEDYVLDSIFEIEELLQEIAKFERKATHFRALKKYRNTTTDEKISNLENKIDRFRKIILDTMKKLAPDDKSIDFSPIGRVVRKKGSRRWEIQNQEYLLDFLKSKKLKDEVVEIKETINKKKLDQILDDLSKGSEAIPGAVLHPGDELVSITYEKSFKPKTDETDSTPLPKPNEEFIEEANMDLVDMEI